MLAAGVTLTGKPDVTRLRPSIISQEFHFNEANGQVLLACISPGSASTIPGVF